MLGMGGNVASALHFTGFPILIREGAGGGGGQMGP